MATWSDFTTAAPTLSAGISALLRQYGPGLAYLATVRPGGGPRIHPVSPVLTDDGLYCFLVASPKRRDLDRDGRYALHAFPPEESDDEAYLSGNAVRVRDPEVIARLAGAFQASPDVDWRLYELLIDSATLRHHGPTGALPLAESPAVPSMARTWHAPPPMRPLAAVS